jgi:uncharacterized protein YbjT (DUF2867 family)
MAEKVSRFIYVSVFNEDKMPDLPLIRAHELFVADLKASGLSWAVIRPNGYFSDMGRFFSMARTGHMFIVGEGEKKMNPIHGADIAKVCVDAVQWRLPGNSSGRTRYLYLQGNHGDGVSWLWQIYLDHTDTLMGWPKELLWESDSLTEILPT